MNARSIAVLALVTGVVLAVAGVATLVRRSGGAPGSGAALLPDFRAQVNDAASLTVRRGDQTSTLQRTGDSWAVVEKDGYPAKFADLKALLLALADLEGAEPKTDNPDLYEKIGVEEPAPGNGATLVTVADGAGAEILSIVLGDAVTTGGAGARFVRLSGQAQSWLVNAAINAPADPLAWVDREIMRLGPEQIALVRTERDGDTLAIVRSPDGALAVEGLPQDRVAKHQGGLFRFVGALSYLQFTDVARLDEEAVPADAVLTTFTRTDGVSLRVRSWQAGEMQWITVGVSRPVGAELSEQARLQAEDYEARFAGWRFAVDESRFNALRPTAEDLSEPRPEEGPPATPGAESP